MNKTVSDLVSNDQSGDQKNLPLAMALNLVGDRWTLMILSSSLSDVSRFNEFEKILGINRSLLSSRLAKLVDAGLMEKRQYQEKPARYEYHITETGKDLRPVLVSLADWSEKHLTQQALSNGTLQKDFPHTEMHA